MSGLKNTAETNHATVTFFTNDHHNFPDTDQSTWVTFATNTSQLIQNILSVASKQISLIELLQVLAKKRSNFAKQQPGIAPEKIKKFGQWRDGVYTLSSQQVSDSMERRIALNDALKKAGKKPLSYALNATVSHTAYSKEKPLFGSIMQNLALCETQDASQLVITKEVDQFIRQAVNQIVKKKFTISPDSFFDINKYEKYTLIDKDNITEPLTSFFVLSKPDPTFFVIIEHPQPHIVYSLLTSKVNELFIRLMDCKENKTLFIEKLGEFLWYCHHLMPFERGSASIFLILTAALLQYAEIPLQRYPDNRLDIDAISLTKRLFTQKFIRVFHQE